jgi:hypothetical protein
MRTHDYRYYGGRGIKVCARWDNFDAFAHDVGDYPGKGWTLDRINNDGNYELGNVRWATRRTQARNRNYCVLTKYDADKIRRLYDEGIIQTELAVMFNVHQAHISAIIRRIIWK